MTTGIRLTDGDDDELADRVQLLQKRLLSYPRGSRASSRFLSRNKGMAAGKKTPS